MNCWLLQCSQFDLVVLWNSRLYYDLATTYTYVYVCHLRHNRSPKINIKPYLIYLCWLFILDNFLSLNKSWLISTRTAFATFLTIHLRCNCAWGIGHTKFCVFFNLKDDLVYQSLLSVNITNVPPKEFSGIYKKSIKTSKCTKKQK